MSSESAKADAERVLAACENDHCLTLLDVHVGAEAVENVGYEDVFYPLRHHHREGLALVYDIGIGEPTTAVWGAGDLIYDVEDEERTLQSALDPMIMWRNIDGGYVDVDVVVIDAEARGEDD